MTRDSTGLFLRAALSVLALGTLLAAGAIDAVDTSMRDIMAAPELLLRGAPFALTLAVCLVVRELARFVSAKLLGAPFEVSWPVPALSLMGTLGTVTQSTGTTERRRQFDLFAVEFVAGLFVALPLLVLGIHAADPLDSMAGPSSRTNMLQRSMVFEGLLRVMKPEADNVWLQPTGFAGWVALYVLALNFLPLGRSAGGQLLGAVTQRFHLPVSLATAAACLAYAAFSRDHTVAVWALLTFVFGVGHPGFSDTEPIGWARKVGFAVIMVCVILLLPLRTMR